jgi:hypothetical protein
LRVEEEENGQIGEEIKKRMEDIIEMLYKNYKNCLEIITEASLTGGNFSGEDLGKYLLNQYNYLNMKIGAMNKLLNNSVPFFIFQCGFDISELISQRENLLERMREYVATENKKLRERLDMFYTSLESMNRIERVISAMEFGEIIGLDDVAVLLRINGVLEMPAFLDLEEIRARICGEMDMFKGDVPIDDIKKWGDAINNESGSILSQYEEVNRLLEGEEEFILPMIRAIKQKIGESIKETRRINMVRSLLDMPELENHTATHKRNIELFESKWRQYIEVVRELRDFENAAVKEINVETFTDFLLNCKLFLRRNEGFDKLARKVDFYLKGCRCLNLVNEPYVSRENCNMSLREFLINHKEMENMLKIDKMEYEVDEFISGTEAFLENTACLVSSDKGMDKVMNFSTIEEEMEQRIIECESISNHNTLEDRKRL